MGDKPRTELFGALRSLYQSRDYSDLIVIANDGSRHAVHRAIVCPRSHYFDNAVKEGQWIEGREGQIELSEDEPEVVRLLIEYLYLLDYEPLVLAKSSHNSLYSDSSEAQSTGTESVYGHVYGASALTAFGGPQSPFTHPYRARTESKLTIHALPISDYTGGFGRLDLGRQISNRRAVAAPPEPSPLASTEPNLVLHARMYTAGYRFGIDGLKALALDKFKIQLTRHCDSHEFVDAIHVVYNTTPSTEKEMREAIADTLGWHSRLFEKPEIESAIMDINGLAYELLKRSRRWEPEYMS